LNLSKEFLVRVSRVQIGLAFRSLYVQVGEDFSRDFFRKVAVLLCGNVIGILSLVIVNIRESASALPGLFNISFLDFLVKFLLINEWNGDAVGGLDENSGG